MFLDTLWLMNPAKFPLSTDQLEILIAFESSLGLSQLAEELGKDPSVISRNLQRIAEDFSVLQKVKGRWVLTPLGHQIVVEGKKFLQVQHDLLSSSKQWKTQNSINLDNSILIIINAQNGLLDATLGGRNNLEAEGQILRLLSFWRLNQWKIIHVRHASENPNSIFYRGSNGFQILSQLSPLDKELIIDKTHSSAFHRTELESELTRLGHPSIVIAGFTANECIDATAKDASALGFESYVVGDATAMFDGKDLNGKLLKAERVHRLTLSNINAFYSKVILTSDIISKNF